MTVIYLPTGLIEGSPFANSFDASKRSTLAYAEPRDLDSDGKTGGPGGVRPQMGPESGFYPENLQPLKVEVYEIIGVVDYSKRICFRESNSDWSFETPTHATVVAFQLERSCLDIDYSSRPIFFRSATRLGFDPRFTCSGIEKNKLVGILWCSSQAFSSEVSTPSSSPIPA